MNHLNITLNLVISVNHYPSKKKKTLVMMNQRNYITIKMLVVSTYINASCFFFSGFV